MPDNILRPGTGLCVNCGDPLAGAQKRYCSENCKWLATPGGRRWKARAGLERPRPAPEKLRARGALNNAVARGQLARPLACEECGAVGKVEGHHEDYREALVVRWLCPPCHRDVARLRAGVGLDATKRAGGED